MSHVKPCRLIGLLTLSERAARPPVLEAVYGCVVAWSPQLLGRERARPPFTGVCLLRAVSLCQGPRLADARAGEHGPLRLRREVHALPATAQ